MFVPGFHERQKDLLNTLMLSEWFIEAPKDLLENWLVLACPKGARVLLIASKVFLFDTISYYEALYKF